jgi:hypothetical protein
MAPLKRRTVDSLFMCEGPDLALHISLSHQLPTVRFASKARFPEAEPQLGPMRFAVPTASQFSVTAVLRPNDIHEPWQTFG